MVTPQADEVWITPIVGGWLRSSDGRIELRIPPLAVASRTLFRYTANPSVPDQPTYLRAAFTVSAQTEAGQPVTRTLRSLTLTVHYTYEEIPDESRFRPVVTWWAADWSRWTWLQGVVQGPQPQVVTQVDRPGLFGLAAAPTDEGKITGLLGPSVLGAGPDLWTGDAGFSYPLELPPGPGGLTPGLSLSYGGGGVNDMVRQVGATAHDVQAGFAGLGWSVGGLGAITVVDDTYYLSFAGGSYELKNVGGDAWRTVPESFLKISHTNQTYSPFNYDAVYANCVTPTLYLGQAENRYSNTDPWLVWTPDGTRYTFGSTVDALGQPTYPGATPYRWGGSLQCGSECHASQGDHTCGGSLNATPYQWNLVRIEDPNANPINVGYGFATQVITGSTALCPSIWEVINKKQYIRESFPTFLSYGGATVVFTPESRTDQPTIGETNCSNQKLYRDQRLKNVTVAAAGWAQRSYDLGYRTQTHALLESVSLVGKGGQPLPVVTTFGYRQVGAGANTQFLETVNNGYGGVMTLTYTTSAGGILPGCRSGDRYVVRQRQMNDGVGAGTLWTYDYGARAEVGTCEERGKYEFLGFGVVTDTVRAADSSQAARQTVSRFYQKDGTDAADVRKGKKYQETIGNGTGTPLQETTWSWIADGDWPRLASTTVALDGQPHSRREYLYDTSHQQGTAGAKQYGNVTHVKEYLNPGDTTPYRTTERWYYPRDDAGAYIVNRVAQEKLFDGQGSCRRQTRWIYDSWDRGYATPPTVGLLYKLRQAANACDDSGQTLLTTRYGYDAWGNRTTEIAAGDAFTTTTAYDTVFHTYPITVTVQPGAAGGPALTTIHTYYGINEAPDDQGKGFGVLGQLQRVQDPNNANTRYKYDPFGRLSELRKSGTGSFDAPATEKYEYHDTSQPYAVKHAQREDANGDVSQEASYLEDWTYYDGLGQAVQTQQEGETAGSGYLVSTRYNALGLVAEQTRPYSGAFGVYQAPNWADLTNLPRTQTAYDGLGRVTQATQPNGATSRTWYNGRQTAALDANGHQMIQAVDGFGRLVSSRQYTGVFANPDWGASAYAVATYDYTLRDELARVVGPDPDGAAGPQQGAVITTTYDLLGRKTQTVDPDMGTWDYRYDAAGNLVKQRDARHQAICLYYDGHNRLKGKTYHADVSDLDALTCPGQPYAVSYTYDDTSSNNKGLGRRTGMSAPNVDTTTWVYDGRGRVRSETKTIAGAGTYVTQYTYDSADRVRTMTYPGDNLGGAGEVVTTAYSSRGLPQALTGYAGYVTGAQYDAAGRPTAVTLGQVTTRDGGSGTLKAGYTYWPWVDPNGGRLQNLLAYVDAATPGANDQILQDLTHEYDLVGNLAKITYRGNFAGDEDVFVTKLDMDSGGAAAASATPAHATLFVPNAGQTRADVRFQARGRGALLSFGTDGLVVATGSQPAPAEDARARVGKVAVRPVNMPDQPGAARKAPVDLAGENVSLLDGPFDVQPASRPASLRIRYLGANPDVQVRGSARQAGVVNYLLGNDPARWYTDLPVYAGIVYEGLYPGIDVRYESGPTGLKSTYVVAPGGDPGRIRWRYDGALGVRVQEASGELVIETAADRSGEDGFLLTESRPIAWQEEGGHRVAVAVAYRVADDGSVGFELGAYDRTRPLWIDPTLVYSVYLGGEGDDSGSDIAVDAAGNVYVTGDTFSPDFPETLGADCGQDGACDEMTDVFVTKLNADGSLVYSTYLGGLGWDFGNGIAVDGAGNVYLAGHTDAGDFPVTAGAFDTVCGSDGQCNQTNDAFFVRLDASGHLTYGTYVGGAGDDYAWDVAVDASGRAYLVGQTLSTNFPTTAGALQTAFNPGYYSTDYDGFVVKLAPTQSGSAALVYGTYLGGRGNDRAIAVAVNTAGQAVVAGDTTSSNLPISTNPYQRTRADTCEGCGDAFVSVLNASGSALAYGTYLGGGDTDSLMDVAVDGTGHIYAVGYTHSTNFPTTLGAFDTTCGTDGNCTHYSDVVVAKLNPANGGSADLLYSSYFGGSHWDMGDGIAVGAGGVDLSGYTYSPDLPITADALQAGSRGNMEAFVARLDLSQAGGAGLIYSTYLGGSAADAGYALAADSAGDVYVTGGTKSVDFLDSTAYPPSRTTTYGYDALDRLTHVNGQERTRYDAAGRLTTKEGASWSYDGAVQFAFSGAGHAPAARSDERGNQEAYSYDANGNLVLTDLTTDGSLMSTRFAWDAENRLACIETGNSSTGAWYTQFEVAYDGDGQRVRRHSPGATGYYPAYNTVYVGSHYEVETVSGEVTQYYFFGGQRIALRRNGVLYYLANDQLGSASVSYQPDVGNVVGQRYEPWGEVNDPNQLPSDYTYTGQEDVAFTHAPNSYTLVRILDYGARYYWPAFGRFISPDSIVPEPGNPQSLNRYTYAANNPLRYTDSTGMFTDDAIKTYLQGVYGDAWEGYWKTWLADDVWMNLLHAAQGGDALLEVGWENGSVGLRPEDHAGVYLRQFRLQGKGHDVLSGISLEQTVGVPGSGGITSLQDLYASQPGGLAVLSSQGDDGNMTAIATWGGAQVATSQVTRNNVRFQKAFQWGFNALMTKIFPPWWLADFAQAIADPDISSLPGLTEGDRTLMVQLSVDVQGHRLTAGYSAMFRGGTNLYGAWCFGATWSPTLPPR